MNQYFTNDPDLPMTNTALTSRWLGMIYISLQTMAFFF